MEKNTKTSDNMINTSILFPMEENSMVEISTSILTPEQTDELILLALSLEADKLDKNSPEYAAFLAAQEDMFDLDGCSSRNPNGGAELEMTVAA